VANEPLKGSTLERKSHIIDKQNYLMKTEALPKPIFQQPARWRRWESTTIGGSPPDAGKPSLENSRAAYHFLMADGDRASSEHLCQDSDRLDWNLDYVSYDKVRRW
jgi:hypothetical protein